MPTKILIFTHRGQPPPETPQGRTMLPTMSVCHDVIRLSDGKIVGAVESIWTVDGSGMVNTDGFPSGGVLNHTLAFGNVPQSVLCEWFDVGACRNRSAAARYKLSLRG